MTKQWRQAAISDPISAYTSKQSLLVKIQIIPFQMQSKLYQIIQILEMWTVPQLIVLRKRMLDNAHTPKIATMLPNRNKTIYYYYNMLCGAIIKEAILHSLRQSTTTFS